MQIHYTTGDATQPSGDGPKIIAHICNDIGGWGRGFVVAISKRWPQPEQKYRAWHQGEEMAPFGLGQVQVVQVAGDTWIANMIAQCNVRTINSVPPIRYDALRNALRRLAEEARRLKASVHMPRIGCGLAGGTWEEVGQIVQQELVDKGIAVTVYDFPTTPK